MKYQEGDRVYIIVNNLRIKPCCVSSCDGELYVLGFGDGGAIRLRESRIFRTKEEAEQRLPYYVKPAESKPAISVQKTKTKTKPEERTPWEWMC